MPSWALAAIAVDVAVGLAALIGICWLLLTRKEQDELVGRMKHVAISLAETAGRLAKVLAEMRTALSELRWGRGPRE
jgi:hypothetical protein